MIAKKLVKDMMTSKVLTVSEDWTLQELARFLTDHGISGAPVTTDQGRLVGVVSVTDVARSAGNLAAPLVDSTFYHHPAELSSDDLSELVVEASSELTVKDIMTSVVFQVDIDATVGQAADTMVRGRIHRVFVVEGGSVVGVVSALDLLRELCE